MDNMEMMLTSVLICMVEKGVFIETEKDAPAEKFIALADAMQIIEDFKKEYKGEQK